MSKSCDGLSLCVRCDGRSSIQSRGVVADGAQQQQQMGLPLRSRCRTLPSGGACEGRPGRRATIHTVQERRAWAAPEAFWVVPGGSELACEVQRSAKGMVCGVGPFRVKIERRSSAYQACSRKPAHRLGLPSPPESHMVPQGLSRAVPMTPWCGRQCCAGKFRLLTSQLRVAEQAPPATVSAHRLYLQSCSRAGSTLA